MPAVPLVCAAHPFSVLAAPSQLTHPSMSLPQLPISRWPPLSQFLTSPLWRCENKQTNKILEWGCTIRDSNPWDLCFLISLWTHRCEAAEINFGRDNRLLRLQENPASVPLTVFFILSCFYSSEKTSFLFIIRPLVGTQNIPSGIYMQSYKPSSLKRKKKKKTCFGSVTVKTSAIFVSVLSTFVSLLSFVVVFLFWQMKSVIYLEENLPFFKSTFKCVSIIQWLYIVNTAMVY